MSEHDELPVLKDTEGNDIFAQSDSVVIAGDPDDGNYTTDSAHRKNIIYLFVVVALIATSLLIPAPGSNIAGAILGFIGILIGVLIRESAKREDEENSIAKLGMTVSAIWVVLNVSVLIVLFAANSFLTYMTTPIPTPTG